MKYLKIFVANTAAAALVLSNAFFLTPGLWNHGSSLPLEILILSWAICGVLAYAAFQWEPK